MLLNKILCLILVIYSLSTDAQVPPPPLADTLRNEANIFTKVDVEAAFPGGDAAWKNYLVRNLNATVPVDNGSPAGKFQVIIKFIISKDGTISEIAPETRMGYGMEEEVIRIIKKSGTWTPAQQNNRTVNAYRRQPVTFLVEEDGYVISTKVSYTFFAGSDNRITIDVNKVRPEDVTATVSQGTISGSGDGTFIIKVTEPGRIILTIYNSKKNKVIGSSSFEVKNRN
jgi:hypothetical protein